jgi:hypothetical protein
MQRMSKERLLILVEVPPFSGRFENVANAAAFKKATGAAPILVAEQVCDHDLRGCLCRINAQATAQALGMRVDVGDDLDAYTYAFLGRSFIGRKTFKR